jgi:hypothetical protein
MQRSSPRSDPVMVVAKLMVVAALQCRNSVGTSFVNVGSSLKWPLLQFAIFPVRRLLGLLFWLPRIPRSGPSFSKSC